MSDPLERDGDPLFAAAAEYGRTHLGWKDGDGELELTDHRRQAGDHIKWAHEQQEAEGEYDHSVRDNATLAVAEATLALVEQQRVANMIAFGQATGTSFRTEIRKALGLS